MSFKPHREVQEMLEVDLTELSVTIKSFIAALAHCTSKGLM